MSALMNDVLELALALTQEEREQVADALRSSADTELPFDPAWLTEAKRRAARIDSGEATLSTWQEVRDRARRATNG